MAVVTVEVVAVLLLDAVVVDTVVVNQVVVAMVTVMQGLQRSDLVLVVRVLVSHEAMAAVDQRVVVVDMVVVLVVEVVSIVAVVAAVDLCKNNQATSNICILLQIQRQQKNLPMKSW